MENNKLLNRIFQIMLRRELNLNQEINYLNKCCEEVLSIQYDKSYIKKELRKINNFTDIITELIRRVYDDSKLYIMFENNELSFEDALFDLKKYIIERINKLIKINIFVYEEEKELLKNIIIEMIMYKILNDKKTRMPSQRAMLFAKEFNKNIDVPFYYGINSFDGGDFEFINVYLNNGGNPNKSFCVNYFSKEDIFVVSIKDYLDKYLMNDIKRLKK